MISRFFEILIERNKGNMLEPIIDMIKKLVFYSFIGITLISIITFFTPHDEAFKVLKSLLSFVWTYIVKYGDWAAILLISLHFAIKPTPFYNRAEQIRLNWFFLEQERWKRTPYIAPLHLYHLLTEPISYSPLLADRSENRFYQIVMNQFRHRVYADPGHSTLEPGKKVLWLEIVGLTSFFPIILGIGFEIFFFYSLYEAKPINEWFTGLERFLIPIIVFIASYVLQQLFAIIVVPNIKSLNKELTKMFNEVDAKIPWRELFADKKIGKMILVSWEHHVDFKQRVLYAMKGEQYPLDNKWFYKNKTIAPYPYPTDEVPEWKEENEFEYANSVKEWQENQIQQVNEQVIKTKEKSRGQVVEFKNKRKSK